MKGGDGMLCGKLRDAKLNPDVSWDSVELLRAYTEMTVDKARESVSDMEAWRKDERPRIICGSTKART